VNRALLSPAERAFVDRVDAYWEGLFVTPSGEGEGHFSRYRCESCGGLAGDRHQVSFWSVDGTDDPVSGEAEVCTDCLMYIANGEVPPDLDDRQEVSTMR
jgi:hypothetical protein